MAGSYNHVINDDGQLASNEELVARLENGGDVFEVIEEMFGMIWWLVFYTTFNAPADFNASTDELVEMARKQYKIGLEYGKRYAKPKSR